jgi:hypothetical protein
MMKMKLKLITKISRLSALGKLLGLLDVEDYTILAIFQTAQQTRQIFKFLYGLDEDGTRKSANS